MIFSQGLFVHIKIVNQLFMDIFFVTKIFLLKLFKAQQISLSFSDIEEISRVLRQSFFLSLVAENDPLFATYFFYTYPDMTSFNVK